jgi:hypothetical protein
MPDDPETIALRVTVISGGPTDRRLSGDQARPALLPFGQPSRGLNFFGN